MKKLKESIEVLTNCALQANEAGGCLASVDGFMHAIKILKAAEKADVTRYQLGRPWVFIADGNQALLKSIYEAQKAK